MRGVLAVGLLLLSVGAGHAASITGLWWTEERGGVVRISNCDGALCLEIAGVYVDRPSDPTPVDYRGMSQCHWPLVTDARQVRPGLWRGHIVDPRNGNVWGVQMHLDPHNNLALRGFFGVPLLGRTQTWTRYPGRLPADCRLFTASKMNAVAPGASPSGALPSGSSGDVASSLAVHGERPR